MLNLTLMHRWYLGQIDYVLAFLQTPIKKQTYTKIPLGMEVDGNPLEYCLELYKDLYGQKQARKVWHEYFLEKFLVICFKQSKYDPCVLYQTNVSMSYTQTTL